MSGSREKPAGRRWQFGRCEFIEPSRSLIVNGHAIKMEAKPLEVLTELLEHGSHVITKEDLLDTVWRDVETTEQSLTTAISKLRKAFGGPRDSIILNVAGIGYRIAVPISYLIDEAWVAPFTMQAGDSIPLRPHWLAVRRLSGNDLSPVWLARHEKTGDERVYKFASDGMRLRALQREVAIYRLLSKSLGERASFLVQILDWSFDEAPFFIESENCGLNLLDWSETEAFRRMPQHSRLEIAAYLSGAVAAAHSLAVFHNDLKPTNILLQPVNSVSGAFAAIDDSVAGWRIKIADFGVASLQNPNLLRQWEISDLGFFGDEQRHSTSPVGTAMYRPPEAFSGGAPTALADIYALGVLLYQIASGKLHEPPVPGWEQNITDPLLRQDISRAAHVDSGQRMQTVAELASQLHNLPERREEKRQQDQIAAEAGMARQALARARARRPWIVFTMCSLVFGLLATLWAAYHAVHDRDSARNLSAAMSSMYNFLAIDLLGQSNPYLGVAGSSKAPQQLLVDAIATAVPQIDSRFSHQPEIAGRLHMTIADALKSRAKFKEADEQYDLAAKRFREAEGRLSQQAIVAEFKREFAGISAMQPGSVETAERGFREHKILISQVNGATAELQAWQTLVESALLGMGPHPEQSLSMINAAVQRAQATPGFDPELLIRLKNQFCGAYVRLGDGTNLERVSREIIQLLTKQHGRESATLFPYQMYLEEAFYLQGKYSETIAQANENATRFARILGQRHRLTLATLATRAAAEGQLERYGDAIRDDLALYSAEQIDHADKRLEIGSLNDAATYECRQGAFGPGMLHARQVISETGPGASAQPIFFNGSMMTLAECIVGQQEARGEHRSVEALIEARTLLDKVDAKSMAETSDETQSQGPYDVALARLAVLERRFDEAQRHIADAVPLFSRPNTDPFEKRELERVRQIVAQHTH